MTKEIKIVISDSDSERYELRAIMDRYENINKLEQIYNHARSILKHGDEKDYREALEDIKELAFLYYGE